MFHSGALVDVFNACFLLKQHTRLVGGAEEPLYIPQSGLEPAQVIFTRDYFASALHEIAHWCIAGEARRKLQDYGYWYAPDGRTAQQQNEFEKVEIKPQALEWIFNAACGHRFRVSADNLMAGLGASEQFKRDIYQQVMRYCKQGLPSRAAIFAQALSDKYKRPEFLCADYFVCAQL
ncbi:hypothetical protein SAMN02745866_02210 [Alteromonadaceae bacterium Bs31]|nr:hypothetical protein SAMN02745866_02210 [Alteromonadaceae bacterium Bs31]